MPGTAIITGAGSGIGRAVAQALARDGWRLALAGRRTDSLEETAALCGASPEPPLCIPTDVCDPVSVDALFDQAASHFGRVDLLFNNAGIGTAAVTMDELAPADWSRVIETNLSGTFYCMRAAFRVMKAQAPQGGRIINNGSIAAYSPRPLSAAYTASKHGVSGLTKSGALDGRPFNIAVGQIDIGNAHTVLAERFQSGTPQADGQIAREPLIDVTHVGDAVAHMASLPIEANVLFMTIMPSAMPFVGRG